MEKLFIIKIGGNVLDNEPALLSFLKDFASIKERKILIHGGGKIATRLGDQLGIKSNYINGRRVTDASAQRPRRLSGHDGADVPDAGEHA